MYDKMLGRGRAPFFIVRCGDQSGLVLSGTAAMGRKCGSCRNKVREVATLRSARTANRQQSCRAVRLRLVLRGNPGATPGAARQVAGTKRAGTSAQNIRKTLLLQSAALGMFETSTKAGTTFAKGGVLRIVATGNSASYFLRRYRLLISRVVPIREGSTPSANENPALAQSLPPGAY